MSLPQTLSKIRQQIHEAEGSHSVLLLAVTKKQPATVIEQAYHLGLRDFAENYYQEALLKINQLNHLPLNWHFIGPIQTNKAKGIAHHFDWVHSLDRLHIAERLNHFRPINVPPLNVCLQINQTREVTKSGISANDAMELAQKVSQLPRVNLRGLMTIPPANNTAEQQYELFLQLKDLLVSINQQHRLQLDTLSMGMSGDFIPAIKAGSTIVRIGTALFGERV